MTRWTAYDLPREELPHVDAEAAGIPRSQVVRFAKLAVAGAQAWSQLSAPGSRGSRPGRSTAAKVQLAALRLSRESKAEPYARALIGAAQPEGEADARLIAAGAWIAAVMWVRELGNQTQLLPEGFSPITGCPACHSRMMNMLPEQPGSPVPVESLYLEGGYWRTIAPETPLSWARSLIPDNCAELWRSGHGEPLRPDSMLREVRCIKCELRLPLIAMLTHKPA